MLVEPRLLDEVISVTAAIWPNCRSRGVATEEAIVSGLAPGSGGDGDGGEIHLRQRRHRKQSESTAPESAIATVSSVVAVGLRMKISDMFIVQPRGRGNGSAYCRSAPVPASGSRAVREAGRQPVEEEIDDRRRIERQQLAQDKSADDCDAKRPAQLRARCRKEVPAAIRPAAPPSWSS